MSLHLQGKVSLDGSGFEAGINKLEHSAAHFGETLKGVALEAFGIFTLEQALSKTMETAKELVTESKRLGIGVEELQVMKQAAKENNVELGAMAKAFEKIDIAREKALGKSVEGQKLHGRFKQLGIDDDALKSQTAQSLFINQIRRSVTNTSPETVGPVLRDIMGKSFGDMIPILSTDFEELRHKMERFGGIMSGETAVALKQFGDELELVGQIILAQLAPAMVWLAETLYKAFGKLAAGSASFGAATAHMKPGEIVGLFADLINPFGPSAETLLKKLNMPAAAAAYKETATGWSKSLEEIKKEIEDKANKLRHPNIPNFGANPDESEHTKAKHEAAAKEDSMIRVGNFLGSSKDMLETLAGQQLDVLMQIESNTRPTQTSGSETSFPPN